MPALPFEPNRDRRHRIPRQKHKVTNWPAYEAGLRQRGSLTVWFTEEAVEAWAAEPRTTRGGQPWYSPLAILTALTLRAVFRLAFRQTEGLIGSVVGLLGLALRVPDHTTLSRRAATLEVPRPPRSGGEAEPLHLLVGSTGLKLCGPGEWLVEKHGTRTRRAWRKLHLGVDAVGGRILASTLTGHDADDGRKPVPCSTRWMTRSPRSPVRVPTTGRTCTGRWPSGIPRRPSSCRRARPRCRATRPRQHPPSATATSGMSSSMGAWPGRKRPGTRSGPGPKPRWPGGSR
jgi:hypothetical protein